MTRGKPDEIRMPVGADCAPDVNRNDSEASRNASPPEDWRQTFLSSVSFRGPERIVSSGWHEHAPFAFWLVGKLKPRIIVELGAHNGFSYFTLCQGVRMAGLATAAFAVDTWTGDAHAGFYGEEVFGSVQRYNRDHYADFSTLMRMSFNDALPYFSDASIDLLHIDGRHHYDDVKSDFETWLPKLSARAVVLFHDINVREREFGVQHFWDGLCQRYPTFGFVHGHGLGVLSTSTDLPPAVAALFEASKDEEIAASVKAAYARLGAAVSAGYQATEAASATEASIRQAAELAAERGRIMDLTALVGQLEVQCQAASTKLASAQRDLQDKAQLQQALTEKEATLRSALVMEHQRAQELEQRNRDNAWLTMECRQAQHKTQMLDQELRFARKSRLFRLSRAALSTRRGINAARRRLRFGCVEPIFAARWYLEKYRDVAYLGADPFRHYLTVGAAEGRDPHPLFDTSWYLTNNPDVAGSGINPLIHFMRHGARELRNPHPLFDSRWYTEQCPDALDSGATPLEHYLGGGAARGLNPHPLFDTSWYLANNPDVAGNGINPLVHFVEFGAREQRSPHPQFDCRWYVEHYPDVLRTDTNPLEHYLIHGAGEGLDPSARFDTDWYRATYPEVRSTNPLVHYVLMGASKELKTSPHTP